MKRYKAIDVYDMRQLFKLSPPETILKPEHRPQRELQYEIEKTRSHGSIQYDPDTGDTIVKEKR